MTVSEDEITIKLAHRAFYEQLEKRTRRFLSDKFGPAAVKWMLHFQNTGKPTYAPYHFVSLMIEANFAYTSNYIDDELDYKAYRRLHSAFVEREDHGLSQIVLRSIDSFSMILHREQMCIQRRFSKIDLPRAWRLFCGQNILPNTHKIMLGEHQTTPVDWIKSALLMQTLIMKHAGQLVTVNPALPPPESTFKEGSMRFFLDNISRTPYEYGQHFRAVRENIEPKFDTCIQGQFLNRPLISYGNHRYLAPFIHTFFDVAMNRLYEVLRAYDDVFMQEFGASVQAYVSNLMALFPGAVRVISDRELERHSPGKSCDLLIEFDDHIILVETKATRFTRDRIVPETIEMDGSTAKIARAITQLTDTAHNIRSHLYEGLGVNASLPLFGIVATYGDIPISNSPTYRNDVITPRVTKHLKHDRWKEQLQVFPDVMSIRELELLYAYMHACKISIPRLIEDRSRQAYMLIGDWEPYLENKLRDLKLNKYPEPPYVHEDWESVLKNIFPAYPGKEHG